jgi:RNA polymerase sigma factor (sigma-70 family)
MQHSHVPILPLLNPSVGEISNINQNVRWAFDGLLGRWKDIISAMAHRFRTSWCDYDDFCQVGRLALYKAVQTFKAGTAAFATYATKLITNAMRDAQRVSLRRVEVTCATDEEATTMLDAVIVEYPDHLVEAEQTEMINRWRSALSTRDEYVVESIYYGGMTMTAVAANLKISTARVSQIINDLRQSGLLVA